MVDCPECERIWFRIVDGRAEMYFVLIAHDVQEPVCCKLPISQHQDTVASLSTITASVFKESNKGGPFPLTVRLLSASSGEQIGYTVAVQDGSINTMDFVFTDLVTSMADDLIVEVSPKNKKGYYVALQGMVIGNPL